MRKQANLENEDVKQAEARIQQDFVMWYRNGYCLAHHSPRCMIVSIPNDACKKNAGPFLATGMYPGAADTLVVHNWRDPCREFRQKIFFVETKTEKGVQSPNQKTFEAHANLAYVDYILVRSADEFKRFIQNL